MALCDSCLLEIKKRLNKQHILLLNALYEKGCFDYSTSIKEMLITPKVNNITKFKFQNTVNILEILGFIGINKDSKPYTYFITKNGIRLLELYKTEIIRNKRKKV